MLSMRTAIKGSPAGRFAQAQTGPGSEARIKQINRWDHFRFASVIVNINVNANVNVSADQPRLGGLNKATRNRWDHLRSAGVNVNVNVSVNGNFV